jgi:protein-disulfide isomerase
MTFANALLRRSALTGVAATLALGLAACGSGDDAAGGAPSGEPVPAVAAPAGQSWVDTAAVTPEGGYRIGNPEAPLKVVEYASHTCSHCAAFSQEGAAPMDKYVESGRVSYEIRNQVHDALDLTIAMLARCGDPATFHPLANQVWANLPAVFDKAQGAGAQLQAAMATQDNTRFQKIGEVSGLIDFFAARGISRDQAMQCLADPTKAQAIADASEKQSKELNVTGTPTFFLNGRLLELQNNTWADLEAELQRAGAR